MSEQVIEVQDAHRDRSSADEVRRLRRLLNAMIEETDRTVLLVDVTFGEKTMGLVVTTPDEADEEWVANAALNAMNEIILTWAKAKQEGGEK